MKKNNYNLLSLIIASALGTLRNIFIKQKDPSFPLKIDDYVYVEKWKKIGPRKSYPLAVYENGYGKKAIAKMKSAKPKSYHYYSLKNEIYLYKILNKVLKRNKNKIPDEFKYCAIPKLIAAYETDEYIISLIEFIDGNVAEGLTPNEKIKIYFKTMEFLRFLGNHLSIKERNMISQRTPANYITLYPLLLIKSLINYPNRFRDLLLGALIFVQSIPVILSEKKLVLVHRDLHFMNIIISKKMIYLIDLQQCLYTIPLHECVTTLRYWWKGWKNENFAEILLKEIETRYSNEKNFKQLFKGLIVNSVTHGLTGIGYSKKIINGWIEFLEFGINYN